MDLQKVYQEKLTTAQEAVKVVKSGDWLDWGWCTGTPDALDKRWPHVCPNYMILKSAAVFC